AVLVLQIQELLNDDVGRDVGDDGLEDRAAGGAEEDDAVFQQQIREGHLPLPGVVAVALELWLKRRVPGIGEFDVHASGPSELVLYSSVSAGFSSGGGAVGSCSSPCTVCTSVVATGASSADGTS